MSQSNIGAVLGSLSVGAIAGLVAIMSMSATAFAAPEQISLLPLKFEISPDHRLGRKMSGIFCAPAGSWRWRDIVVDQDALESAVRASLTRVGWQITKGSSGFGESAPLADLRLRGRVTDYALNACIPWKATEKLRSAKSVQGTGRVTVVWELYSATENKVISSEVTNSAFHSLEARDQQSLFVEALARNAAVFATASQAPIQ